MREIIRTHVNDRKKHADCIDNRQRQRYQNQLCDQDGVFGNPIK